MRYNEPRKLLAKGDERMHNARAIAEAYGVCERETYKLVQQKRETGSVALRTNQRGRKLKMTADDLRRLKAAIEEHPDKTLGELREELICRAVRPA